MPYEVIKKIGGRAYRYSVESYRDPDTGRVRNRWTYIGKVTGDVADRPVIRRKAPDETRCRIIAARKPWAEVTPGAVATEAGVAHGTFYRHFRNREALLDACAAEAYNALDARLHELTDIAPDLASERKRLRAWVMDLLRRPTAPAGLMRVIIESIGDAQRDRIRSERRTVRITAFADYISALRERGYAANAGEVRPLATALSLIVEMLARRTTIDSVLLSEDDFSGAVETFDRTIFWQPPEA
jgi:AcrR family transcriptional regulator